MCWWGTEARGGAPPSPPLAPRYAAQENLSPLAKPCAVPHADVGRYFTAFSPAAGYLPNAELAADYPDDLAD